MKRTPLKRTRRSLKTRIKQSDREWSAVVGAMAGFRCQKCGKPAVGNGAAHHIIPRRFKAARFSLDNGIWLCRVCHTDVHAKPVDFKQWLHQMHPDRAMHLQAMARLIGYPWHPDRPAGASRPAPSGCTG